MSQNQQQPITLSAEQLETLAEATNIAMGQAGSNLAELLGEFVELRVPMLRTVTLDAVAGYLTELSADFDEVGAVRQSFSGSLEGEAITLFNSDAPTTVADLLGYEGTPNPAKAREVLLDLSNVIIGACLNGIVSLMHGSLGFSRPVLLCERLPVGQVIGGLFGQAGSDRSIVLVLKVHFRITARQFDSDLLVMLSETSMRTLQEKMQVILRNL